MDKQLFSAQMDRLLQQADALIPCEQLPALPCKDGIPAWHTHELHLWNIGEAIRQLTLEARSYPSELQMEHILQICRNPAAGRGRQSFVLLFGKTRYRSYAESLARLLADPDVSGHAINTLYKMRAPGYADQIRPFLSNPHTWIRNEAKRYLSKYD